MSLKNPFGKSCLVNPDYIGLPDVSPQYAIYQATKELIKRTDIKKGLSIDNDYYRHFIYEDYNKINKTIKLSASKYIVKLKTSYLMNHLYNPKREFLESRRRNYKYYMDKISNDEPIQIPHYFNLNPEHNYLSEGNHRVIAMNDSGYKTIVCVVVIDYHSTFRIYKDVKFVNRW